MEYETADILDIKSSDLTYETLGTRHQISDIGHQISYQTINIETDSELQIYLDKGRETDISYVQRQ